MKAIGTCSVTRLTVGQMQENCYVVQDKTSGKTMIIDPGDDGEYIIDQLTKLETIPIAIIVTHGHFDHIMAGYQLQFAYSIPLLLHADDLFLLSSMQASAKHFLGIPFVDPPPIASKTVSNNDIVALGRHSFTVIHTPGHTPGSICLYSKEHTMIFTGDTVLKHGQRGRTDFSYSDKNKLLQSIENIFTLPDATWVYAGHGDVTTIGEERMFWEGI